MPPFPIATFVGVGVGVGLFLLLVLLTSVVVLILAVVVDRRKGAHKQKKSTPLRDNLWCDNSVVVTQEMEMKKEGVTADNAHSYEDVDYEEGEEDDSVEDVFNHYEFADSMKHIKNTNTPVPEESSTLVSGTNGPATVVDKSKKGTKTMVDKESSFATNNDQYALPMIKCGTMTETGEGVVVFSAVEEEQYDDTVVYEPKADSKIWQPSIMNFK